MRGHNSSTAATMMRSPNPMDPFDNVKRWWAELWPIQQLGVVIAAAVVLWALSLWIFR